MLIILFFFFSLKQSGAFSANAANTSTALVSNSDYEVTPPWSSFAALSGVDGKCRVYTMDGTATPKYPLLDTYRTAGTAVVLDVDPGCIDDDQIRAQKGTHTCQYTTGPVGGYSCIKQTGGKAVVDEVETLYQPCGTVNRCTGQLSLIALNYNDTTRVGALSGQNCLSSTSGNAAGAAVLASCKLDDMKQRYRVVRYSAIDNGTPKLNPAGNLASIVDRMTGKCLAPKNAFVETSSGSGKWTVATNSAILNQPLVGVDCSLAIKQDTGTSYSSRSGVWWRLQPSQSFTVSSNTTYNTQAILFESKSNPDETLTLTELNLANYSMIRSLSSQLSGANLIGTGAITTGTTNNVFTSGLNTQLIPYSISALFRKDPMSSNAFT
jgi:hypothetical protein